MGSYLSVSKTFSLCYNVYTSSAVYSFFSLVGTMGSSCRVKMLVCTAYPSPLFSVLDFTVMKSYNHSLIHFLGIVFAYAQWKIYILTMRNTTNKFIYKYVYLL